MARLIHTPNHVMATERAPGRFRPGNQMNMVSDQATNPFTSVTTPDAFMPGMGECRSGNGVGDLGLGGWGRFRNRARQAVVPTAPQRGRAVYDPKLTTWQNMAKGVVFPSRPKGLRGLGAVYTDSTGKVISKQQHDALQALAKNPEAMLGSKAGMKKLVAASQQAAPKVIVNRLSARPKPVNGLGRLGEIATSPLVLGGLAIAALYFLNKSKTVSARH